jgi:hypothetical protein
MGFLMPKPPAPPVITPPPVADVPKYDDPAVKAAEQEKIRKQEIARKGRRSTILTGTGLTSPADIEKKTLLGG